MDLVILLGPSKILKRARWSHCCDSFFNWRVCSWFLWHPPINLTISICRFVELTLASREFDQECYSLSGSPPDPRFWGIRWLDHNIGRCVPRSCCHIICISDFGGFGLQPWWFCRKPSKLVDLPCLWRSSHFSRRQATLDALSSTPVVTPGVDYQYSNWGFMVAGHMLEDITGIVWEDLLNTYLFTPLGLTSAYYGCPDVPVSPSGHQLFWDFNPCRYSSTNWCDCIVSSSGCGVITHRIWGRLGQCICSWGIIFGIINGMWLGSWELILLVCWLKQNFRGLVFFFGFWTHGVFCTVVCVCCVFLMFDVLFLFYFFLNSFFVSLLIQFFSFHFFLTQHTTSRLHSPVGADISPGTQYGHGWLITTRSWVVVHLS